MLPRTMVVPQKLICLGHHDLFIRNLRGVLELSKVISASHTWESGENWVSSGVKNSEHWRNLENPHSRPFIASTPLTLLSLRDSLFRLIKVALMGCCVDPLDSSKY